jgi:putative phosphoribosyl transferase
MCGLSDEEVRALARAEEPELERRRQAYLGSRRPIELGGKTAIIVDDGIATGATMRAAIKSARSRRAAKVVVAVPVAAQETIDELKPLVDDIICLATPSPFWAVGQHYADFPQVSDEAVVEALSAHRAPDEA